jgi:hypothetical protein
LADLRGPYSGHAYKGIIWTAQEQVSRWLRN